MALALWKRGETLPVLPSLSHWSISPSRDVALIATLTALDTRDIQSRFKSGHVCYLAWRGETPVGYGWAATSTASIGELGLSFPIPMGNLYLWDFATLPHWRGQGAYPHLLQGIVQQELTRRETFWILHAPENHASKKGIGKAGFHPVDELLFLVGGGVGAIPLTTDAWSQAGAALLGIPLLSVHDAEEYTLPCWYCAGERSNAACAPKQRAALVRQRSCACMLSSTLTTAINDHRASGAICKTCQEENEHATGESV